MSADFAAQVTQWLDARCRPAEVCASCRENHGWVINPQPILMDIPAGDGSEKVPLVTVTCRHCAYVRLYSARMLGWEPPAVPGS